MFKLITDGAFSSSKQQMGIGIVILNDNDKIIFEYNKMYKGGTNNLAEMIAVIIGLRFFKKSFDSLIIITDSMYIIGCMTLNWQRKKNQKMWQLLDKQYELTKSLCPSIKFEHTKGHQKDDSFNTKWNNYVDNLAQKASTLI